MIAIMNEGSFNKRNGTHKVTSIMFFNILFITVFLFCMFLCLFCVLCVFVLSCILCLLKYTIVSFLFVYKFTDHCNRMKSQLH